MSGRGEPSQERIAGLEARLLELRDRLAALEIDLTVERARLAHFTGEAAARWEEFRTATAAAWDAYMLVDECCSEAKQASPSGAGPLLDQAEAELDKVTPGVEEAEAIVAGLRHRWNELELRIMDARGLARAVDAEEIVSFADLLLELVARDPLALSEEDVTTLETQAETARLERVNIERRADQLDKELQKARLLLEDLTKVVAETRDDPLAYARSRVTGLPDADPVSPDDLNQLQARLAEISSKTDQTPATRSIRLGEELFTELERWLAECYTIRTSWDAALTESRSAIRRRDQFRGTWKALRAKASACGLDEDPDVGRLMAALRELLWTAPLDLAAAEEFLTRLAGVIIDRCRRVQERL